jgi:hypothetical protein
MGTRYWRRAAEAHSFEQYLLPRSQLRQRKNPRPQAECAQVTKRAVRVSWALLAPAECRLNTGREL